MKENYYNCIYMYINKINGKRYIGQAKNFNKRHDEHTRKSINKIPIDKAFNKYGKENFEIIILKENLSSQCLMNLYECYYIKKYNTLCKNKNGYNIASGGHNGNVFEGKTEEEMNVIKNNMSKNNAKVWQGKQRSDETKRKIGESKIGNKNMFGKKHSEESIQKMRDAQKGKKFSDEHKKNLALSKAVPIVQYNKNNELINIFTGGSREAERILKIDHSSINKCCKGIVKTAGNKNGEKFIWKYLSDIDYNEIAKYIIKTMYYQIYD